MTHYINLLQGKIVRYEEGLTSKNIKGIFTDGITSCYILIFSGTFQGRRRFSAIHCDGYILNHNSEIFIGEKEWVGDSSSCVIYRDPKQDQEKIHPFVLYAKENQISLEQKAFNSSNGTIELAITFDNSKTGYSVSYYFNGEFKENISSHPLSNAIHAYYISNLLLNEVDINAAFMKLYRTNPSIRMRWDNYQMTFTQKNQRARLETQTSNFTPGFLLFDGNEFVEPGSTELQLTEYSQTFFNDLDNFLSQDEKTIQNKTKAIREKIRLVELRYDVTKEQIAIISLIKTRDNNLDFSNPNQFIEIINQASAIREIYLFIKNNFDVESIRDPEAKVRFKRFRSQLVQQEQKITQINSNTSIVQSSILANFGVDEAVSQFDRMTVNYRNTNSSAIKAIIFDLGGVIINLNYALTVEAFRSLGGDNFDKIYSQFKQSELFDRYETGQIDDQAFKQGLMDELDLPMTDEQFDTAWNAMLLDLPKERLDFIKSLRQEGFATFLFSNTNAIHLKKVFEICQKTAGVVDFSGCFIKEYYSHTFGMRKPRKESFMKILENHDLKASETLFVDDTPQHIKGAKQAGIHTMLIDKEHSIFDIPNFIAQLNKLQEEEEKALEEAEQYPVSFGI